MGVNIFIFRLLFLFPEGEDGSSRDRSEPGLPVSAAEVRAGAEEEMIHDLQTFAVREAPLIFCPRRRSFMLAGNIQRFPDMSTPGGDQ